MGVSPAIRTHSSTASTLPAPGSGGLFSLYALVLLFVPDGSWSARFVPLRFTGRMHGHPRGIPASRDADSPPTLPGVPPCSMNARRVADPHMQPAIASHAHMQLYDPIPMAAGNSPLPVGSRIVPDCFSFARGRRGRAGPAFPFTAHNAIVVLSLRGAERRSRRSRSSVAQARGNPLHPDNAIPTIRNPQSPMPKSQLSNPQSPISILESFVSFVFSDSLVCLPL